MALSSMEHEDVNEGTFTPNTDNITIGTSAVRRQGHVAIFKIMYKAKSAFSPGAAYTVGTSSIHPAETEYYVGISSGFAGVVTLNTLGTVTFSPIISVPTTNNISISGSFWVS